MNKKEIASEFFCLINETLITYIEEHKSVMTLTDFKTLTKFTDMLKTQMILKAIDAGIVSLE